MSTRAETVVAGLGTPYGIGYDSAAGSLLWTSSDDEVVRAASVDGRRVQDLPSSFEDEFAVVTRRGGLDLAYAVIDGAVMRLTRNRLTGEERQETLVPLAAPKAVRGLALSADGRALYLGDEVGRMAWRLSLATRSLSPLSYREGVAPPTPRTTPAPRPAPGPTRRSIPSHAEPSSTEVER